MKNLKTRLMRQGWKACFCLTTLSLSACAGSTTLISDETSTSAMRLAKPINRVAVFVPSPDKKSWLPAYVDLSKGTWIFTKQPEQKK